MLEALKQQVLEANRRLVCARLVFHTFGNVSGIDRDRGLVVIKPSGVSYETLSAADMVVVALNSGASVEGSLRPSSDTLTHLALYRAFTAVGGVAHTHSLRATAFAQARREIPCLGTTHADYFEGAIPCTRPMTDAEIAGAYEANTGTVIAERFAGLDPLRTPAVLVAGHGPFAWGRDAAEAAHHAAITEFLAELASETLRITADPTPIPTALHNRHFRRKHGPEAYYGQF